MAGRRAFGLGRGSGQGKGPNFHGMFLKSNLGNIAEIATIFFQDCTGIQLRALFEQA